jgi:hypothetical protein
MFPRISCFIIALLLSNAAFCMAVTSSPKLPQTGQTTTYSAGDDGALQSGVPFPNPRFTDNSNGTLTDNLTGLIWLKNANCFNTQVWTSAVSSSNTLASGACGLTDASVAGQWRLPNVVELESLVNAQEASHANWLTLQGFTGVQGFSYWSSSTNAFNTNYAWIVYMSNGIVHYNYKASSYYVWPVRGGQ